MPKVNWNEVEDQDFSPLPEGKYDVVIEKVTETQTSKGDDMWNVQMTVVGDKYKGRKVFTNLVFNDGGYGNIKKLYSVIFGTKLPKNCEPSDIEGEKITVDIAIKEYNGKMSNTIPYAAYYACEEEEEEFA